jgi:glycosyltransferase involved in cell wall biosynthesis
MKLSGYTYVRNGIQLDYPFVESIKSVLSICDEFIVVLGDSQDKSREAIQSINSDKIRIVDSVWDFSKREGGVVFAEQSNIGLDHVSGDWVFHIQADEVIHEDDLYKIKESINKYDSNPKVQGMILPYYHFWGGYNYIRTTRKVHRYEVRLFRNLKGIRSYRDSQGFRLYSSVDNYLKGETGKKLRVKKIDAPMFHYKRVRPPEKMKEKMNMFFKLYKDDAWLKKYEEKGTVYDYNKIDKLEEFHKSHPAVMKERVDNQNWEFVYDKSKQTMKFKYRVLYVFEKITGYRLFEYKNYKII